MKGRKPKPTAFKLIEGNRGHRTIDDSLEPKPEPKAPKCPTVLRGPERQAWKYLVQQLGRMGTLATSDRGIMAGYCHAYALWSKGKRKLLDLAAAGMADAEVIMNDKGNYIQNPWLKITNNAMADVVKYGAFLGLDPTSRTRVKLDKPKTQSRRERLLA
jgi:P27 family predicted phage terminase small subunit